MGNKSIFDELDLSDRADTKRLREILEEVNLNIKRSSRKTVYETLKKEGYEFTFGSFVAILGRLRKEDKDARKIVNVEQPSLTVARPTLPAPAITQGRVEGSNPLHGLSNKSSDGIPEVKFEVDHNERK